MAVMAGLLIGVNYAVAFYEPEARLNERSSDDVCNTNDLRLTRTRTRISSSEGIVIQGGEKK
jgi:hypothetical protein